MGCSPSKGKLLSRPDGTGPINGLLTEAQQDGGDSTPVDEDCKCLKIIHKETEHPLPTEEHPAKEAAQHAEDKQPEVNVEPQEIADDHVQTVEIKKNKGKRRSSSKQGSSIVQTKVEFPPHMVRAHQAAYAFLNPNISKYETLLDLLDQAAQTQSSLQPMMSALVLRFEEINQALEYMAEEGELMLKEHGDYMALPSGMMGPAVMQAKPAGSSPDPPPDLLHQLLQHSTERMRLLGGSFQSLGDTTLEEAAVYFSSLSKLLIEKLQTKQIAERRLGEVLARVEGAALRKSNPEDTALHSEDSGIGGENESLTGSERHRHHRGSAESGSCGSGINIRGAFDTLPSNLPSLVGHIEDDEEDEDDDEEYADDESERPERKRSNSSPPDPSQPLLCMRANDMQNQQSTVKRPLTAISKPAHSSPINIIMELQKSKRDLDQRLKKIVESQENKLLAGPHYNLYRGGLRRHSLSGSAGAQKGPFKTNQSPCSLPVLAPQPPKHQSVRRLINTFSQGVDGRPGQGLANVPPHIRRPRKSEMLQLSGTGSGYEGGLVINGNNNNNSWPDSRDDLDADSLPPPPPEVLMDDSFQSSDGIPRNQEYSVRSLPAKRNQITGVSQRLKASVQNVEVLPDRVTMKPRSISILPAHPVRQGAVTGTQDVEWLPENSLNPEMEKANCLYQQARKIIHLANAAEALDKRTIAECSARGPLARQATMGQKYESNDFYGNEMPSCSTPVIAPPVSRVRLPQSCPTVRHRFPSPPVIRPQTSRPSSRPGSPRMVTRATDNPTEEIIPSVSFHDARSVFCQRESQNSQNISEGSSRGRKTIRGIDSSTRRTQSEQRPTPTSQSEFFKDGSSAPGQARGSGPVAATYRPGSPLMTGDDTQLDPSAAVTTA